MEMLKEIRKYKDSEDSIILNTRVKYWVFCQVLDILLHHDCYRNDTGLMPSSIGQHLNEIATFDYHCRATVSRIDLYLEEMVRLKLIDIDQESRLVSLSDAGFTACQDQRFHSICATLYEARYSRRLSVLSLVIAIIALLCSAISCIIN